MIQFEWNHEKAKKNYKKHGVNFEEAATAFYDSLSATFDDPDHSVGEQRLIIMGKPPAMLGRLSKFDSFGNV